MMSPFVLEMFNCGLDYAILRVCLAMEMQIQIVWLAILEVQVQVNALVQTLMPGFSMNPMAVLTNAIEHHILPIWVYIVNLMKVW